MSSWEARCSNKIQDVTPYNCIFFDNFAGLVSLIRKTYGLNVFGDPYWTCQVILVPFYGCSMCSTYFILSMTFERSYSITQPHKAASSNTVKRAKIIIICIVVVFMIFNIPRMFLSEMEGLQCNPYGKGSFFWGRLYMYTELIISFIFPFISLLSMNCVIIHTLRLRSNFIISKSENYEPSQMEVKSQGQPQGSASKIKSAETQITVTLLVVTFSFLILTTPAYIILMLSILVEIGTTPRDFAMWFFLLVFGEKLFITNNAINFFLYVVSGHRFRADLVKLLICMRDKPNKPSLSLSKITTLSETLSE